MEDIEKEKIDINELFTLAMNDPTLFSTLDIERLLESVDNEKNDYLENKNMDDITKEIYEAIDELKLDESIFTNMCKKLIGYRYVDEINELHKGKHIRWIRKNVEKGKHKLTNGGIVVNIKFMDNGIHIITMNSQNRFHQYKFDECITFQKLSTEEQLILMAYNNLNKK
jgi:hypothetical protein